MVNSEHLLRAAAQRIQFNQGMLVPEAVVRYKTGAWTSRWDGKTHDTFRDYLADLMWVTGSGYATELEIKVSRADWRADRLKGKWGAMPQWISRFIYVVPQSLGIPDFVHEMAGVWHYAPRHDGDYRGHITIARAPRKIGKEKVPESVKRMWLLHLHCRFWHQRLYSDKRLPRVSAEQAAA